MAHKYKKPRQIFGNLERNRYIDLKINGKLFPSFILKNFKKYKLEELLIQAGIDPCAPKPNQKIRRELKKYQIFITKYMDYRSPYRAILIYHGLGSGKTASAINIYNMLYTYSNGWNLFIFIKASLKGEWLKELKNWLSQDEYEYRFKNIIFINYDSPFADRDFLDSLKNVDSAKKSCYFIDEVHNFIRNVYSNVTTGKGKRAQIIYDYIIQDQRENPDTRVVLLSGTPVINKPFELALLYNLLRSGIFPRSESEFNNQFISTSTYQILNPSAKNLFQRRIMGLTSYYIGSTPDLYASKTTHYIDVPMSEYQEDIYSFFEDLETKSSLRFRGTGRSSREYKTYTRQGCNFVFPPISQKISGENRPRPSKFKLSLREALQVNEGTQTATVHVTEYLKAMELYISGLDSWFSEQDQLDTNNKYTILDDVSLYLNNYKGEFLEFLRSSEKKSNLFQNMALCSRKFLNIIFNIMRSLGPTMVYSNFVYMEGLEIFKIYLKYFGFYNFMDNMAYQENKIGFVEFHGGIKDLNQRFRAKDEFNKSDNKYGTKLKIMLISPAGAEGLSLSNVRQVHIMEPYWNEVRINQAVGRAIRQCQHKDLPLEERHVDVYRYKSVRTKKTTQSTDQYIEELARRKEALLESFIDAMKEVAVDCGIFRPHNMLTQQYNCFQFEEPSLFDRNIGPAYKEDLYDDLKFDNGSNSVNAMTIKIKVMKIKAVVQLNTPEAGTEYSQPENYWYYSKSGTVYDYDLYYAVGKVAVTEDNIPIKLDKDTYVIDKIIPIPVID